MNRNYITVGSRITGLPVSIKAGKQVLCHYGTMILLLCLLVFQWLKIYVKNNYRKKYMQHDREQLWPD